MKNFFAIVLVFAAVNTNAQRLNPLKLNNKGRVAGLTNEAHQAQIVAAVAHNNAANVHTNAAAAATASGNLAAAAAHTNAATEHTNAEVAANTAAANFAGTVPSSAAASSSTSAVVPATNAKNASAAALLVAADASAVAADQIAEARSNSALAASQAVLAVEDQNKDHRIEIQGLGNIAGSQNGSSLSPSASVNAKILFLKNKNAKFYLGYNLGQEIDSTKLDSIKLANLFLPDRSKSGFSGRIEYNILSIFKCCQGSESEGDYNFDTELSPFIEYNYNKINIKGTVEDSSKIQTSSWIYGFNFSRAINTNDNTFGVQISPYIKTVKVTAGTSSTYSSIFTPTLKGIKPPEKLSFAGITIGLQINRFLFSFDYQSLLTKTVEKTPLHGGVFTLRATVTGDLIKL
ncbi:MAG: hypothetical protein ABIN67_20865 [Ferruginibacter sp.]